MLNLNKNKGFTLIEIVIALAINAFLLIVLVTIFAQSLNNYQTTSNTNRLNEQLESAMYTMTREIRRAGYSATASNDVGLDQNTNPFMAPATDVNVNVSNNCILFTYDHANNGTLPAISSTSDDDRYGFRLNGQTLQTRPPGSTFNCVAPAANWENMTDPSIVNITNLTFTLNQTTLATGPGTIALVVRSVDISLTGQLVSDSTVTRTLTQHVRIRNDKFIP